MTKAELAELGLRELTRGEMRKLRKDHGLGALTLRPEDPENVTQADLDTIDDGIDAILETMGEEAVERVNALTASEASALRGEIVSLAFGGRIDEEAAKN
jgi:hypothetical protein